MFIQENNPFIDPKQLEKDVLDTIDKFKDIETRQIDPNSKKVLLEEVAHMVSEMDWYISEMQNSFMLSTAEYELKNKNILIRIFRKIMMKLIKTSLRFIISRQERFNYNASQSIMLLQSSVESLLKIIEKENRSKFS